MHAPKKHLSYDWGYKGHQTSLFYLWTSLIWSKSTLWCSALVCTARWESFLVFPSAEYSEYVTGLNTLLHLHCICGFSDFTFLVCIRPIYAAFIFFKPINTAHKNLSVQDTIDICGRLISQHELGQYCRPPTFLMILWQKVPQQELSPFYSCLVVSHILTIT